MTKKPLSQLRREVATELQNLDQGLKPAFEEEPLPSDNRIFPSCS